MNSRREQREEKICKSIKELRDNSDQQTCLIKDRWRENYDMFVCGSQNDDKEEWQTNFSINKLGNSIRIAQGKLVNILVQNPEWYTICPKSGYNKEAESLAPAFKKIMDYYLESAKFKRHAGTFFMCSLISAGNIHIGWKSRMVQNPEYVLEKTEKSRRETQQRLAKNVVNPQVEDESLEASEFETKLSEALDDFAAEAQGEVAPKKKTEPYVQVGCLDLMDINHEKVYWDPNVMYMEDSLWRAFEYEVNLYELNYAAKLGFFSKSAVKRIGSSKDLFARQTNERLRYKNILPSVKTKSDLVKLTVYSGPLIIKNEVVQDKYFAIIANDNIILKDGEYPYWEPPGHQTSVITAAVRQIPYRATGAGIGDNATQLQKIYDSNWQLVCDTFRFGISGINVVNYQNLVDRGQIEEGIYPGMTLHVRGKPSDNFERVDLTSNLENQASPVQTILADAIDTATGINELMAGGNNPHSRTPAAETNARIGAGNENVNIIALDLEQNFIIPALQKIFARILQFGLSEININPELAALLNEEEAATISSLSAGKRLEVMNQWYRFEVKGFSSVQNDNEQAQRDNELLQIINSNGPLTPLINLPEFMLQYFRNRRIKDPQKLLIINNSPTQQVTSENQLLLSGHMVMPSPNDDHEFHLNKGGQAALAQSPYATPEAQQHAMYHQQMMAQMQAQQQGQPQAPQQA